MGRKYADERKIPHRDGVRHAQPEDRPHRARKDRRRWCRGKPGVEHTPELRYAKDAEWNLRWHGSRCLWWPRSEPPYWICGHEYACTECGRITNRCLPDRECPAYVAPRESGESS